MYSNYLFYTPFASQLSIQPQNKNSRIVSRVTRNRKFRTETQRRDEFTMKAAASTDQSGATTLFVDNADGSTTRFTGSEARTLYKLLQKHFEYTGKSV